MISELTACQCLSRGVGMFAMRLILFPAAVWITFVATLPLSTVADAKTRQQCYADYNLCMYIVSRPSNTVVRKEDCDESLSGCLATEHKPTFQFIICPPGRHQVGRYCVPDLVKQKNRLTKNAIPQKRSIPPAGLLETTPSFAPQGPSPMGTPNAPPSSSTGRSIR